MSKKSLEDDQKIEYLENEVLNLKTEVQNKKNAIDDLTRSRQPGLDMTDGFGNQSYISTIPGKNSATL